MKKLLLVIAASLIAMTASAQKFGVVAGFTSSNASLKNFDASAVGQYHIGVASVLPLNGLLSLQPEILYNVKGTSLDQLSKAGIKGADVNMKMGYLEAGLQVQLGFSSCIGRIYGLGEPFIGYAVNDKLKIDENSSYDIEDAVKNLEYGLAVGAGIEITEHLQLAAKYYWNFGSLYNSSAGESSEVVVNSFKELFDGGTSFNGVVLSLGLFF